MLSNQLESLESVAYAKLAEFIQSERLGEASYLVDIMRKLPSVLPVRPYPYLLGDTSKVSRSEIEKLKQQLLDSESRSTPLSSDYPFSYDSTHTSNIVKSAIHPQNVNTKALDGYSTIPAKPSEYTWNDGSKDPREDYWRDG